MPQTPLNATAERGGKKPERLHRERVLGGLGLAKKLGLAWWLRENTTVTLRWVSERLGMGHYLRQPD